jgi:hypothetical protein
MNLTISNCTPGTADDAGEHGAVTLGAVVGKTAGSRRNRPRRLNDQSIAKCLMVVLHAPIDDSNSNLVATRPRA